MPLYVQNNPSAPLISLSVGDAGYSFGTPGTATPKSAASGGLTRNVTSVLNAAGVAYNQIQVSLTTTAAHKFQAGQLLTLFETNPVGNTNFDGTYLILSVPTTTTAILIPLDPTRQHQGTDTAGGGVATSVQGEDPAVLPQAGQAFALKQQYTQGVAAPFSADGYFDGAPGAFEVDVQTSDTDVDTDYVTVANGNQTAVNANNSFHFEAQLNGAKFARLKLVSLANSVNFIGIIKR